MSLSYGINTRIVQKMMDSRIIANLVRKEAQAVAKRCSPPTGGGISANFPIPALSIELPRREERVVGDRLPTGFVGALSISEEV